MKPDITDRKKYPAPHLEGVVSGKPWHEPYVRQSNPICPILAILILHGIAVGLFALDPFMGFAFYAACSAVGCIGMWR